MNRLSSILCLLLFSATTINAQASAPCNKLMKFCDDNQKFDSIEKFKFFDSSIGLFQSAFFTFMDETRAAFLNPNPQNCASKGYSEKQRSIQMIQQLGNIENRHDENDNTDDIWYYQNNNSPKLVDAFIGNVLSFERCAYVLNFAYYPLNLAATQKQYNIKRYTVSIQYVESLKRKKTVLTLENDYTLIQGTATINHEDMPCSVTEFYYHPGLRAVMYLMDDQQTLVIKSDRTVLQTDDLCEVNFLHTSHTIWQQSVNIVTKIETDLNFKVKTILDNWVFLNNNMYIVVMGYSKLFGTTTQQSMIVSVSIALTAATTMSVTVKNVSTTFGTMNQIAGIEVVGFPYTLTNSTGFFIGKIDTTTYTSLSSTIQPATLNTWRIYQARVNNHMHRPVYVVQSTEISKIYRLTTTLEPVIDDLTLKSDFYNYQLMLSRYHALVVNPGTCTSLRLTSDYDNIKAILLNLRRMEVEKCLDLTYVGCGDAKAKVANGEQCDDGNLNSGDGCSATCQIEAFWSCVVVEGQQSYCSPITCGNGVMNAGEECDDFNFLNNDGCSDKCIEDLGYKCTGVLCKKMCGDGAIYQQKKLNLVTNALEVVYQEQCDGIAGCGTDCKPILGWTCTVNAVTLAQNCIMTCGNNAQDPLEVCDDGNNVGGDGCPQGCLVVEESWQCPQVGACKKYCGNGIFEGVDLSIGMLTGVSQEKCDDGNYLADDGCSKSCTVEVGWTCINVYQGIALEIPTYKSVCTKDIVPVVVVPTTINQYFRKITASEFSSNDYSSLYQTTGKFKLVEYKDNLQLFGVSFVANGVDSVTNPLTSTYYAYEYTKIKQLQSGAFTFYSSYVNINGNSNQESIQRNSFGQFFIKSTNLNQLGFYTYVPSGSDVLFQKFYQTNSEETTTLIGNPEVYWWPKYKVLMARKIDGYDWKTFKFTENVLGVAQSSASFDQSEQISNGFKREFTIAGKMFIQPIFQDDYIVTYTRLVGKAGGSLRVHKYYEDIDLLVAFNEENDLNEYAQLYSGFSFVYFGVDFGLIFKVTNQNTFYLCQVPYLKLDTATLNPNGFFTSADIPKLTLIQRREDPLTDLTETRDVYGYFDNLKIYKFEVTGAKTISAVSEIALPTLGIFIATNRMIDVGKYHLAVYSAVNCDAVSGITAITKPSAWFYTFSTSTWSCFNLDLADNSQTSLADLAWTIPVPVVV